MARFPRTLGDALAAQAEAARSTRTEALGVDALAPISYDNLAPDLTNDLAQLGTDLTDLSSQVGTVDDRINQAINDANALPITSDRFTEDSLDIWPFIQGTVPSGALAPGAVSSSDISDFAITVKKLKDDRHRLY